MHTGLDARRQQCEGKAEHERYAVASQGDQRGVSVHFADDEAEEMKFADAVRKVRRRLMGFAAPSPGASSSATSSSAASD